jgi:hypothetical protein
MRQSCWKEFEIEKTGIREELDAQFQAELKATVDARV